MSRTNPSPTVAAQRSPLSHKGRGSTSASSKTQPSPLAGEGDLPAKRGKSGEGAKLAFAKKLRREMTEAERKLWQELRAKRFENYKFRRQMVIGPYIADFVCLSHRLIVEVDGSQHDASAHDAKRDAYLRSQGFRVLRLWNIGVLQDMDGALLTILDALNNSPSPASRARGTLPHKGGGLRQMRRRT